MSRINVYRDEDGEKILDGWFDTSTAEQIDEDTYWDGNNHRSVHTSDAFDHQCLYRTKGGRWVLCRSSQWQNVADSYEFVTDEQAKTWLLKNSSDDIAEKYFGELEPERGPGRPAIGDAFSLRFPDDLLAWCDAEAKARGLSRAALIRTIVEERRAR